MLQLRRWPNGETRVVDTETNFASDWLRCIPSGSLRTIALPHDLGDPDAEPSPEGASAVPGKRRGPLRSATIAKNASDADWLRWDPPEYEIIRQE
jgi:hypothetical protein